jgi:RNA processing factor Prp31
MKSEKWIVGEPGGPAGPFWSVVSQSGRVIAMQIIEEKDARLIASLGAILACDFNTIKAKAERLRDIESRDFDEYRPIVRGEEDYVIRAVIEALFGE